jgi:hypothetical protein
MGVFYHIDRINSLKENIQLSLTRYNDVRPIEIQEHVNEMFPEGVSTHGERYFLKNESTPNIASPNIEIFFEYVRKAFYPERPSRFQSYFGFETISDASNFSHCFPSDSGITPWLWEVEAELFFKADMNLLNQQKSVLIFSYLANKYWKGETINASPIWEVLLIPPIIIKRRIE